MFYFGIVKLLYNLKHCSFQVNYPFFSMTCLAQSKPPTFGKSFLVFFCESCDLLLGNMDMFHWPAASDIDSLPRGQLL